MVGSSFIRWSGVASIVAGATLVAGHAANALTDPVNGSTAGALLGTAAHVAMVFGLTGAYLAQDGRGGRLGAIGYALSVTGAVLIMALVGGLVLQAGGALDAATAQKVPAFVAFGMTGPLALAIGLVLFGAATARAGVLPRPAGALLGVSGVLIVAGYPTGILPIFLASVVALTIAFIWIGGALLGSAPDRRADVVSPVAQTA